MSFKRRGASNGCGDLRAEVLCGSRRVPKLEDRASRIAYGAGREIVTVGEEAVRPAAENFLHSVGRRSTALVAACFALW